jgi:hypothetical protein
MTRVATTGPVLFCCWNSARMGLFAFVRRMFAPSPQPPTGTTLPPVQHPDWQGYGYLGAVGESQYQPALRQIARAGRLCEATLVAEPDNPFDVNAVAVKIGGELIGYVPRSHARRYQRRLLTLGATNALPSEVDWRHAGQALVWCAARFAGSRAHADAEAHSKEETDDRSSGHAVLGTSRACTGLRRAGSSLFSEPPRSDDDHPGRTLCRVAGPTVRSLRGVLLR